VQFQIVDQAFQLAIIFSGGRGGAEPGGAGGLGVDGDEHYFYFAGRVVGLSMAVAGGWLLVAGCW
jgi:hypothetical protein